MKILITNSNILAESVFVYQLSVEKVCAYLLLKNGDKKSREKTEKLGEWWENSSLWNFGGSDETI